MGLLGPQFMQPRQLDNRERRARFERVERLAFYGDGPAGGEVLGDGIDQHWRALEHQPFGSSADTIDNGALQELTGGTDDHPTQADKPATFMKGLQEPLDIGAIGNAHIDVPPAAAIERLARGGVEQPGAGRSALDPCNGHQRRTHRHKRRPQPAERLHRGNDGGRHPFKVEIDRRQRGMAGPVIDEIFAARNDARMDAAIEPALGDDLHLVRQVRAQGPADDRLGRFECDQQFRVLRHCREAEPVRASFRHYARRSVAFDRPV